VSVQSGECTVVCDVLICECHIVARSGGSVGGQRSGLRSGQSRDHGLIPGRDERFVSSPVHPHSLCV
jgi:hypothetical protein